MNELYISKLLRLISIGIITIENIIDENYRTEVEKRLSEETTTKIDEGEQ